MVLHSHCARVPSYFPLVPSLLLLDAFLSTRNSCQTHSIHDDILVPRQHFRQLHHRFVVLDRLVQEHAVCCSLLVACNFQMSVLLGMCDFVLFEGFTMSTFIFKSSSSNSLSTSGQTWWCRPDFGLARHLRVQKLTAFLSCSALHLDHSLTTSK